MLIDSALVAFTQPDFRHIVQDKFGTSDHSGTADWMTKATPGKWHRTHTENGNVDVTQKKPGMTNVQSPVINDGKSNGKGVKPECTMPLCKERHHWTSKDGKKNFEKISTFFVKCVGVPAFRLFHGTSDRRTERFGWRTWEEWWSPLAREKTKCYLCHRRMQTWSERGIWTDGSLIW